MFDPSEKDKEKSYPAIIGTDLVHPDWVDDLDYNLVEKYICDTSTQPGKLRINSCRSRKRIGSAPKGPSKSELQKQWMEEIRNRNRLTEVAMESIIVGVEQK